MAEENKEQQVAPSDNAPKVFVTKMCPVCGAHLTVEKDSNESVQCPYCDTLVVPIELNGSTKDNKAKEEKLDSLYTSLQLSNIGNPTAGLAFYDSYVLTYDWESFNLSTTRFTLPDLNEVVGNLKISSPTLKETWLLEARSIMLPITKKIEGLNIISKRIEEMYLKNDDTDIYEVLDNYRIIVNRLLSIFDVAKKHLLADEELFNRYGPSAVEKGSFHKTIADFLKNFEDKVYAIKEPQDLKNVQEALLKRDEEFKQNFLETRNIDPDAEYEKAIGYINNREFNKALDCLRPISNYKDSQRLISRANKYIEYFFKNKKGYLCGTLRICDTYYYVSNAAPVIADYCKHPNLNIPQTRCLDYFTIYAINESHKKGQVLLDHIKNIVTHYGTILYYIDDNNSLKTFNFNDNSSQTIEENLYLATEENTFDANLVNQKNVYSGTINNGSFIRYQEDIYTNYFVQCRANVVNKCNIASKDIIALDLDKMSGQKRTLVNDVNYIYDLKDGTFLYVNSLGETLTYNIAQSATNSTIPSNCKIAFLKGNHLIYTKENPTKYNLALYIKDFHSPKENMGILLEENIVDVDCLYKDYIFYCVGDATTKRLIKIKLDGTNRQEVLNNYYESYCSKANSLYYLKGEKYNKTLFKINIDTFEVISLANNISEIHKFIGDYLFYTDIFGYLCCVRSDGTHYTRIVNNVYDFLGSHNGIIYFTKKQYGGTTTIYESDNDKKTKKVQKKMSEKEKENLAAYTNEIIGYSLYSVNTEGKELKKILFSVDDVDTLGSDNNAIFAALLEDHNYVCKTKKYECMFHRSLLNISIYNLEKNTLQSVFMEDMPVETAYRRILHFFKKKITLEYEETHTDNLRLNNAQ
jgi:hypothetical protein